MLYFSAFKRQAFWTFLVGATFVCCGLIIYKLLLNHKTRCSSEESCSNLHKSESARLNKENCGTPCDTKECIEIANIMIRNMNLSANPCEDFRTFACGNYDEQFEKESNHYTMDDLNNELYMVIRDIIETSNETHIAGSTAQKLKTVYDSCLNSKYSDISGIRSMEIFLNQIGIPNWPHLDSNFSFRNQTLEEIIGELATYQERIFLKFSRWKKLQGQDIYNLSVTSQNPTYHDDLQLRKLKKVVTGILQYTGMNNKDINRTWKDFLEVENGIRALSIENSEMKAVCKEVETRKDAYVDCSHRNENETMLCRIWDSVVRNGENATYFNKDGFIISCEHTHYIEKLPSLLSTYNHRALAHYIALRVVIDNLKYMSFAIRKNLRYFILKTTEKDLPVKLDRWKFCVSWTIDNMPLSLGLIYVNRMWGKDATDQMDNIMNVYKQAFIEIVQDQYWMDDATKAFAVKTVEDIENNLYTVIEMFKTKKVIDVINREYRKFLPTQNDFFRNVMHLKRIQFIGEYLINMAERDVRDFNLFSVGASGGGNSIELSFGILLPPFFKYGYPNLFNIAKIGQLIGHEIGHNLGFHKTTSNETRQNILKKKKCLVEQFSSYELKRIKQNVDGNYTFGENFADSVSIKVTEKIAEQLIRTMEEANFTLPGLPYSPEELFYISYAQMWCEIRSTEKEEEYYNSKYDNHSPMEYRIIGPLQNSKKFSEVFHCPSTSYMNPEKKCLILE